MSKNICLCCKGKSEYLDSTDKFSEFLCPGCEIKIYYKLHNVMEEFNFSKEEAYKYLRNNKLLD